MRVRRLLSRLALLLQWMDHRRDPRRSELADVTPVQVSPVPEPAMLALVLVLLALFAMTVTRVSGNARQRRT